MGCRGADPFYDSQPFHLPTAPTPSLDLSKNEIKAFPDSMAKLTKLTFLVTSYNKELEVLPTCFKNLVNLKTLDCGHCGV